MARFEVIVDTDEVLCSGKILMLSGPEGKHLARVRRIRKGTYARVKDGMGIAFSAEVVAVSGDTVRIVLIEEVPCPDDTLPLVLMPAVIKGNRMDWLVQKACELGVREIRPVITSRTVAKSTEGTARFRRWQSIATQALKQCSGNMLTRIHAPVSLPDLVDNLSDLFKIMLWEGTVQRSLMSLLSTRNAGQTTGILAGPEGGFSQDEVTLCTESGFVQASLGTRILRTETASVVAAAQFAGTVQQGGNARESEKL